ncbi:hypothetical protein E2C01_077232 [Portunus trituberculatus]|uniref:MADF domain-containing protein n=1 Tax=Portunus trituberculatus TaxID=210409 RepID=A0A5B7IKV3_PORTR|nr:hypothetical protein [Portunus trituberculatus]
MVVKKINNLRTTYRKELKKVQASKKSGAGAYDVYVPKLWYFENLAFLHDQETPREGLTNIEENESELLNLAQWYRSLHFLHQSNPQRHS